ncbi:hypothetical protein MTO96_019728 [Rhipicephalus appendiculatus]
MDRVYRSHGSSVNGRDSRDGRVAGHRQAVRWDVYRESIAHQSGEEAQDLEGKETRIGFSINFIMCED